MTGKSLLRRLGLGEVVLSDGGMGTLLIGNGLWAGDCPDAFNLTNPVLLEKIARQYREAGAEILHTCTFGSAPLKLADYGLEDKTEEINQQAVSIARRVAGEDAYVAADVGPTGKIIKPYGDTDPEVIYEGYCRQLTALSEAGVDLVTVETMIDLQEAVLAVKAAKEVASGIPVLATMTFDKGPKGYFTVMGVGIEEAATGLRGAGADVVGSNCGNGLEVMIEIAREFKKVTDLPVMIQSNAGKPEIKDGTVSYPESKEFFAEKTPELLEVGVSVIGGCCGTTPDYIRAMRNVIDSLEH